MKWYTLTDSLTGMAAPPADPHCAFLLQMDKLALKAFVRQPIELSARKHIVFSVRKSCLTENLLCQKTIL